jgi:hypothetical protein
MSAAASAQRFPALLTPATTADRDIEVDIEEEREKRNSTYHLVINSLIRSLRAPSPPPPFRSPHLIGFDLDSLFRTFMTSLSFVFIHSPPTNVALR